MRLIIEIINSYSVIHRSNRSTTANYTEICSTCRWDYPLRDENQTQSILYCAVWSYYETRIIRAPDSRIRFSFDKVFQRILILFFTFSSIPSRRNFYYVLTEVLSKAISPLSDAKSVRWRNKLDWRNKKMQSLFKVKLKSVRSNCQLCITMLFNPAIITLPYPSTRVSRFRNFTSNDLRVT